MAREASAGGQHCKSINAQFSSNILLSGCTSPVGLCTAGTVDNGQLRGTFSFTALGLAPFAGMPGVEAPTTLSLSGAVVFNLGGGDTVTSSDVGIFDSALGLETEVHRINGGTGRYAGATGELFGSGFARPDGSGFDGELHGTVCY
ncbi:MAG: hypothetical protein U1E65_11015 [Myxococcota bacterium]